MLTHSLILSTNIYLQSTHLYIMFLVRVIQILLIEFCLTCWASECQSLPNIWTYYPCSFIISSPNCDRSSIDFSIDLCKNRELTFFWHFPIGNMSIRFETDSKKLFFIRLFKISFGKKKSIRNLYHLTDNETIERELFTDDENENEILTIPSNEYHQCSIKFTTTNKYIFDYGTLIRLMIIADD